jgi:hypothetical protein
MCGMGGLEIVVNKGSWRCVVVRVFVAEEGWTLSDRC